MMRSLIDSLCLIVTMMEGNLSSCIMTLQIFLVHTVVEHNGRFYLGKTDKVLGDCLDSTK